MTPSIAQAHLQEAKYRQYHLQARDPATLDVIMTALKTLRSALKVIEAANVTRARWRETYGTEHSHELEPLFEALDRFERL